jgi:hypothetical protein
MNNNLDSIAQNFTFYDQLGRFDRWKFRRSLSRIASDAVSLAIVFDYEKKLRNKSFSARKIAGEINHILTWYNTEDRVTHAQNRLKPDQLPEFLQILIPFFDKDRRLHAHFREFIRNIIFTSNNVIIHFGVSSGVTPEQFRQEAARVISDLDWRWETWFPHINDEANLMIGYLTVIANKVDDPQKFARVCQDLAPVIGFKAISSLFDISKDFQEFEGYFQRVTSQLKWWKVEYKEIFPAFHHASELNHLLAFLEILNADPRMAKCINYNESHFRGTRLLPLEEVKAICLKQDWGKTSEYGLIVDGVTDKFVENIVKANLDNLPRIPLSAQSIRWPFDRFTEYVPFEMKDQDWTVDNEKTRPYWNFGDGAASEYDRFRNALMPRLCSIFKKFDISEIENIFSGLPNTIGLQKFSKTVLVPVEWEKDTITQEGYTPHYFYDYQVDVARPVKFEPHEFTFDRFYIQDAIDYLDRLEKAHETSETHRNSDA